MLERIQASIPALSPAAHHPWRRIEFYGVGDSGIVAQRALHNFSRVGVTRCGGQREQILDAIKSRQLCQLGRRTVHLKVAHSRAPP